MHLFDRVEEKEINGNFEVYAIDEQDNRAYLLRDVIINTSASAIEGLELSISCHPEKYIYRGVFTTEVEIKAFADNIMHLIYGASKKNYAIRRT
jgi:hypothetical protein